MPNAGRPRLRLLAAEALLDPDDRASCGGAAGTRPYTVPASAVCGYGARIVSEPISDYVRYEYDLMFADPAAGEEVRWLPRRRAADIALPGTDFRVFDGAQGLFHHFTGDGHPDEDGCEYTDDPATVKLCADAFGSVWQCAIPHEEYRPR